MSLVLDLDDPRARKVAVSGGKGAALATLRQARFPVPPGLVVTASASLGFLSGVERETLDRESPALLAWQCASLRERLLKRDLSPDLVSELRDRLPPLLELGPVAVRSSATLEDMGGAAFAGLHETALGVSTGDDVLRAIKRCLASLYEDRAVRYREERGFGKAAVAMAVVVQSMVRSTVSGVAFTIDPVTGGEDRIVVDSAWGLGESVVSGEGADHFVLDRKTGNVLERTIGDKTHEVTASGRGTEHAALAPSRRSAVSLTDAQLERVRRLALAVEEQAGFPQDVEWAFEGEELRLLQSRPVTTFPARWTRDESAERFPNAVTPLTWDFVCEGFHESLTASLELMGMPPFRGRWFERFAGYVYGNETAVRLFAGERTVPFRSLDDIRARIPWARERYRWLLELPLGWAQGLDGYLLALGAASVLRLEALADEQVLAHVHRIDAIGRRFFRPNIAISLGQALLHRALFAFLVLVVGEQEAPALHDALTGYCETKTSLVNRDLLGLLALVREDVSLRHALETDSTRMLAREGGLGRFPAFQAAFARFLEDHGHREVDFDAYHPTWSGQSWVVLDTLRLMLERKEGEGSLRERNLRERQETAERILSERAPEDLRFFASELVRLARAYTSLDDLEHYETTRLAVPFRAALVELGRRLVAKGVLALPEDVFFLTRRTLEGFVRGETSREDAAREAKSSKSEWLSQREKTPEWALGNVKPVAPPSGEGVLRGIPGSSGAAEGPVVLVRSVEDFARFAPGSVLVARTTNPAWTPLFYAAKAVVVESGGPLSHGAVTAREVGLPAVMSVRGAMTLLEEGELVSVDGSRGVVTRRKLTPLI